MKQHTTPCKACPWRRDNQAPGWLGSSSPGEFLQQLDSGLRMPCRCTIDYEEEDWPEKARKAPECAGAAIHRANRCKSAPGTLKLPADHALVFTRPHEFVAHHARQKPEDLEQTLIFDLYKL